MAKRKLPARDYLKGIFRAALMSFRIAPWAVAIKLTGAVLDAILPIATTYFAALATTELAAAYGGNEGAGSRALEYVVITGLLGIVSIAWSSLDKYIQTMLRYKVDAAMSDVMYERFLSIEFWRYEDKDTIDTYDKAQQFAHFYAYVFDRLSSLLSQLISLVASVVALALFVPWIALMVLVLLVPSIYFQFKLSRAQIDHWNKNVATRRAKNNIEWNLLQPDGIPELRVNGLVRYLLQLRNHYREKDERQRIEFERRYMPRQLAADVSKSIAEVASLVWITLEIIARHQPIGQFVYVQQIVSRAIGSTDSFITTLSNMDEEIAQLFDYQKFMEYPVGIYSSGLMPQQPQMISVNNVSFAYHGSTQQVLKNISLSIPIHKHIAIVGENGAGKSTLIKLLMGMYQPTKGTIMIDQTNLADIAPAEWHRSIAVLQQSFLHYNFATIRDNVYFGDVSTGFDQTRHDNALQQAEAKDFVDKLPRGEKTVASKWMSDDDDDSGTNLSGGQWQRLALARSFYRDAPIIILDEPTSAIDALAETRIFRRLFAAKDKTIITISHRLTTVAKADYIYVLRGGKIVEQGTHTELVARGEHYVTIFESQLGAEA